MNEKSVAKAIIAGSTIVGVSIIVGCLFISRAPRFEKTGTVELIETRSGSMYVLKGEKLKGQPFYQVLPGPGSADSYVEPQFKK